MSAIDVRQVNEAFCCLLLAAVELGDSKLKFGRRLLLLGIQAPIPPKRYLPTGHHIGTPSTRTSVCKPQSQNVCCQVLIRTYEVEEDCCRR